MSSEIERTVADPAGQAPAADLGQAFLGLWNLVWRSRLTVRRLPRILPLLLALPVLALLAARSADSGLFLKLALNLHLMIAVPLFCLIGMAGLIRDEAEQGTLATLSVRPLKRGVFFLLLHAAHLLWIELFFLASGILLLVVGLVLRVPDVPGLVLPFLLAQAAGLFAFSGLSAVIGLLTRRYLVIGLLYGAIIEIGIGGIPTNINALSLAHHVRVIVSASPLAADFLTANQGNPGISLLVLLLVGLLGTGLAAFIYSVREFIDSPDA